LPSIPVRAPRFPRAALLPFWWSTPDRAWCLPPYGSRRGVKLLVASRRQRRWDLWIVDRWLPFRRRFRGVRLLRVPPNGRAASVRLRLEQYVPAPKRPSRGVEGACRGPRSGKFSGGNRDGPGGTAGTPAPPSPGRVRLAPRPRYIPAPPPPPGVAGPRLALRSYLVDSASSHMLVSKIKPCMSKYKHSFTVKLRMAH
jgi:hypothetical protein